MSSVSFSHVASHPKSVLSNARYKVAKNLGITYTDSSWCLPLYCCKPFFLRTCSIGFYWGMLIDLAPFTQLHLVPTAIKKKTKKTDNFLMLCTVCTIQCAVAKVHWHLMHCTLGCYSRSMHCNVRHRVPLIMEMHGTVTHKCKGACITALFLVQIQNHWIVLFLSLLKFWFRFQILLLKPSSSILSFCHYLFFCGVIHEQIMPINPLETSGMLPWGKPFYLISQIHKNDASKFTQN